MTGYRGGSGMTTVVIAGNDPFVIAGPGLYMSRMSDYFANRSSITITFRMFPE